MAFASSSSAFGTASLFRQSNPAKPQGSLFESTQPSATGFGAQPQTQPSTQGPSLFGGSFGQQQPQQPQQQPAQTSFGRWGGNTGATPLQAQPTQPAGSSAFAGFGLGSSTTANTGGSLFAQPKQQQSLGPSTAPPTGLPLLTTSTKFNDLPEEIKKTFESIDSHIQGRVQISDELKQRNLGEEATKGQELIRGIHKIKQCRTQSFRRAPSMVSVTHNKALVSLTNSFHKFFERITAQMRERLNWYKPTIEQIERKLSATASQAQYTPQAISATLQAQHNTFLVLASKTAARDAELQEIKAQYTQLWQSKTGSMRDPFYDLDRSSSGDFGLYGLRVG